MNLLNFVIALCALFGMSDSSMESVLILVAELESDHPVQNIHRCTPPDSSLWFTGFERLPMDVLHKDHHSSEHQQVPVTRLFALNTNPVMIYDNAIGYSLLENPNVLIIYKKFCASMKQHVDSTVRDFWFSKHLIETGLTIDMLYISAPLRLTNGQYFQMMRFKNNVGSVTAIPEGKISELVCGRNGADFGDNSILSHPTVRYIIAKDVFNQGTTVADYMFGKSLTGKERIVLATRLGAEMIETLQQLHSHGVIHGDANFANFIRYRLNQGNEYRMKMMNFDHARIFNESDYVSCATKSSRPLFHPWKSIWEINGCTSSYRDDIYRVFLSLAVMMYGGSYWDSLSLMVSAQNEFRLGISKSTMEKVQNLFLNSRERGAIFEMDGIEKDFARSSARSTRFQKRYFRITELIQNDVDGANTVRDLFGELRDILIGVKIQEKPKYSQIITILNSIEHIVRGLI